MSRKEEKGQKIGKNLSDTYEDDIIVEKYFKLNISGKIYFNLICNIKFSVSSNVFYVEAKI